MPFKKSETYKIILGIVTILTVAMGIVVWFMPPSIFPDPSWGFRVMQEMRAGGGFNILTVPSLDDISVNASSFLSWWSPGQYLTPYFFIVVFGVNLGKAAMLTVVLSNLSGLAGFYYFFKKAGFTKTISALGLIFIVLQQAFWIPYAYYNGGELLIFTFLGWFLYGCITLKASNWKLVIFVLLSGLIGFFCKSSFMWMYVSGLLCLWIRLSSNEVNILGWLRKGIFIGIPAVMSLAVIYVVYLSKGDNPASTSGVFKLTFEAITFPLASPFLAGFSVDDSLNGLIFSDIPYTHTQIILILSALSVLSVVLILLIVRFVPHKDYKLFLVVFYVMSVLFFSYSFLKQAVISYEARHFRIIGLLLIPGLIYLVSIAKAPYRMTFLLICAFIGYKTSQYIYKIPRINKNDAHGITGLSQQFIDQPALDKILMIDRQNTNVLFVFLSPDICLEIQHNRTIAITENTAPYVGHAEPIYLLAPVWYTPAQMAGLFKNFPGYKNFTAAPISKRYVLYKAQ